MTRGAIGIGNGRVTAKASKERFQSAVALLGTAASTETPTKQYENPAENSAGKDGKGGN